MSPHDIILSSLSLSFHQLLPVFSALHNAHSLPSSLCYCVSHLFSCFFILLFSFWHPLFLLLPLSPPSHHSFCFVLHHPLQTPSLSSFILCLPLHTTLIVSLYLSAWNPSFIQRSFKWNTTPSTVSLCMIHPSHTCSIPPALIYHSCRLSLTLIPLWHSAFHRVPAEWHLSLYFVVLYSICSAIIELENTCWLSLHILILKPLALFYTVLSRGPWMYLLYILHPFMTTAVTASL